MVLYRSPDLIKKFLVFFPLYESMKNKWPSHNKSKQVIFDPSAIIWTILVEVH